MLQFFAMARVSDKRSVLIVDDHPIVREGMRSLLERDGHFEVRAQAGSFSDALDALSGEPFDIAIIDISLQGADGLELTKTVRAQYADLPILIVSMHDETLYAERALSAGANGYIMKEVIAEKIVEAVTKILRGDIYVSEAVIQRMFRDFSNSGARPLEPTVSHLSDRELEVLRHIGEGHGTRQIAEHLSLSVKTIETYRAHIKEKLVLANANELVRFAISWLNEETK